MRYMHQAIKAFIADERGSMSMEFVIWLPYLVWWFVFSMGVFIAWDNQLSATLAAQTVTDVMSRKATNSVASDPGFIDTLFLLNKGLLPQASQRTSSQMRVSYLVLKPDGLEVIVSEGDGLDGLATDGNNIANLGASVPPVPLQFIPDLKLNDSIYLVETYVPYQQISSYGLLQPLRWRNIKVVRPRVIGDGN